MAPELTPVAIYLNCWYQSGALNGWGCYVATIVRDDQELHRTRRRDREIAIQAARDWAAAQGLAITLDNTAPRELPAFRIKLSNEDEVCA